jgi:hypothetical protein
MRRVALVLFLLVACFSVPKLEPHEAKCYEDMECWDCYTMGNKMCGGDRTWWPCWAADYPCQEND